MVVIVNAGFAVDKADFPNRLNGLRADQTAGQGLRLGRTLTGQKTANASTRQFRTFVPVDMHGFIHSAVDFGGQNAARMTIARLDPVAGQAICPTGTAIGTVDVARIVDLAEAGHFFSRSCER